MTAKRNLGVGPGTLRLLSWVARLGVAGVEPTALALGMSQTAAYSHIARLKREGLVWRVGVGDGEGTVVAVTRAGARRAVESADVDVVSPRASAPSTARHGRAVSWVAASLERSDREWLGPAQMRVAGGWRAQRLDGAFQAPDLGLVSEGRRYAIEVELQPKSRQRLRAILDAYRDLIWRRQITRVIYVVDRHDVDTLVRREGRTMLERDELQVGPLAPLMDSTRELGQQARSGEAAA